MNQMEISTGDHAAHFRSAEHEFIAGKEGIWIFMVTEILTFGVIFLGYFYYFWLKPEVFHEGASYLDWRLGALNTFVLIVSSWLMALGVHYVQVGENQKAFRALLGTILCGGIFMLVKYFEYSHKIHVGLLPPKWFHFEGVTNPQVAMFFGFYFTMTGLHGLHVLIGMALIAWILWRLKRGEFSPSRYLAVEGVGIFWHIVDLVWIFLFPTLYLIT